MAKTAKENYKVPVVAIRGSVVFPNTEALLTFGRPKSVAALNSSFQEERVIAIFTQKDPRVTNPKANDLYHIGTLAKVTQMMSTDGEIHALVRGQSRVKITKVLSEEPYILAETETIPEAKVTTDEVKALSKKLTELFKKAINLGKQAEIMTVMRLVSSQVDPKELVDQVASLLDIKTTEKQKLLEELSLLERIKAVYQLLTREVSVLEIEKTISSKTQKRFELQMRKAMLREKKKTIEEELGEEGEMGSEEILEYKKKIKAAKMPKDVHDKATRELKRLDQLSIHSPESGYIRNYLDWLCDMPWSKLSPNTVSIKKAERVLDNDHYGLKKAKERITEYLAVMKIKNSKKSKTKKASQSQPTILCFIGPPGVGKTSIGKSIAHALGRKFVRVSLGGIRDEAEIRGHRRTYVGAMPGRIIQGIKDAGTRNPVFMLDEVDKVGIDFRGDPSSALLEALDPEQNKEFSDHYLEVPFDLSDVVFIATGNMLDTIPPALRDRMEIITFPGYTEEEKLHIAKKYLLPKQLELHGIEDKKVKIADAALKQIIARYTREAGVRGLERNLAAVCRKIAKSVAEKKRVSKSILEKDLQKLLGPAKFSSLLAETMDTVGMATGLAVTGAGGEILFIEVSLMPGKGRLMLTGQLGDVMKESARAAFTWARAHWEDLGLKEDFAGKIDVHVHVPEGAVPKDGPSAGIALSSALVSALTGVATRKSVGMTGEVTLRGRVLEIGGVKEKVIAGHRAGLKTIILPIDNKKDMEDVPDSVKKDIKFHYASSLEEVLKIALIKWPVIKRSNKPSTTPRPTYLASA